METGWTWEKEAGKAQLSAPVLTRWVRTETAAAGKAAQ